MPAQTTVAVHATTTAETDADAWMDHIPEAVDAVREEGPVMSASASDADVSLDFGFDNLSSDEMDALAQAVEQIEG